MNYRLSLSLLLLLARVGAAQDVPPGGRLRPVPLPPGGLVAYRQGLLWGLADTAGQLRVPPRFRHPAVRPNYGPFIIAPAPDFTGGFEAVNARGETLRVEAGQALQLLPDSSLAVAAPNQPGRRYVPLDLAADGRLRQPPPVPTQDAPPPLPTGELPYQPGHDFYRDGRYGPLGFSRQIREKWLWPVPYFNSHFELKWGIPEGPKALANARNHRLTGYHYGQIFPFHDGRALFNRQGRHGYLDRRGRQVIAPGFGFDSQDFYQGRAIVTNARKRNTTGTYALIDTLGRLVIPFAPGQNLQRSALGSPEPPLLVGSVPLTPGAGARCYEFYTLDGQLAFRPLRFEEALPFEQGLAWVRQSGKVGLLQPDGTFRVPCRYDELVFEGASVVVGPTDTRWLEPRANASLARIRSWTTFESPGYMRCRLAGRYGYLRRTDGQEIIPPRYEAVQCALRQGFAFLQREGQVYMVDTLGRELAAGAFQRELIRAGRRYFQLSGPQGWCLVDTTGQRRVGWQPAGTELVDFSPAAELVIVRRGSDYAAVAADGTLRVGWGYAALSFWGPSALLGELPYRSGQPNQLRYVAYDGLGRPLLPRPYAALGPVPGTALAVLYAPAASGTDDLVVDTRAGGVVHRLPGGWRVKPYAPAGWTDVVPAPGQPVRADAPALRGDARPTDMLLVRDETGRLLGVLSRSGRRFWQD